jgi:hypothetical protein
MSWKNPDHCTQATHASKHAAGHRVLISLIAQSFSGLKRRRGAYLSFLSQSAFFFATTRHGWKALTAQQQQIRRVLWSGFCGQILWSDGT